MEKILRIENLSLCYEDGEEVNKNINLSIEKGQIFCIVGESGSGKTSLLRAILGTGSKNMEIKSGQIYLEGKNLLELQPQEKRKILGKEIGVVPQNPAASYNPIRKYKKQIREALRSHGLPYAEKEILELFKSLGLPEGERILESCPYEMSGGMNQRIALAVAMLLKPKLLLCDEATSALDLASGDSVVRELLRLRRTYRMSILFITHHIGLAARLADKIGVMYKGELVEYGDARQVLESPMHSYTKGLLRDVPRIDTNKEIYYKIQDEAVLEMKSVYKAYHKAGRAVEALHNVSFRLKKGEILGIVGESGCGKSTLLRQLACLEKTDRGEITVVGEKMQNAKAGSVAKYLQMVFQDPVGSFDPHLRIVDSLHETLHHFYDEKAGKKKGRGLYEDIKALFFPQSRCCAYDSGTAPGTDERIRALLREVDLEEELLQRYPGNLSGGQCQRMAIARAVSSRPAILLCDEATSSLDVSSQRQIMKLLLDLREKYALSILFVSHDLALVSELCDRVLVMEKGRIVEEGESRNLILAPKHSYTRKLLSYVKEM